jgi:hypothetical protein
MQVHRHAQLLDLAPERLDLRLVEVLRGVLVSDVAVAIDKCADEAVVTYRALEFVGRLLRRLQRHRCERAQALGVPGDELFGGEVVHLASHVDCACSIRDPLDSGLGERQDRDADPVAVHVLDPLVGLLQPTLDVGEVLGVGEVVSAGRVEVGGLPVLLERDLVIHDSVLPYRCCTGRYAYMNGP